MVRREGRKRKCFQPCFGTQQTAAGVTLVKQENDARGQEVVISVIVSEVLSCDNTQKHVLHMLPSLSHPRSIPLATVESCLCALWLCGSCPCQEQMKGLFLLPLMQIWKAHRLLSEQESRHLIACDHSVIKSLKLQTETVTHWLLSQCF